MLEICSTDDDGLCISAEIVKMLLERKADVTKVTGRKDTALHGAVYGNSPDVIDLLIKAGKYLASIKNNTRFSHWGMDALELFTIDGKQFEDNLVAHLNFDPFVAG